MDFLHTKLLGLASRMTGLEVDGLFTFHRALLSVALGVGWWEAPGLRKTLKTVYSASIILLCQVGAALMVVYCLRMEITSDLGQMIYMNNIVGVFTINWAALKLTYFNFFVGRKMKDLLETLESLGEMECGRSYFDSCLKITTMFYMFTVFIVVAWDTYFWSAHGVFILNPAWPWDQSTALGRTIGLLLELIMSNYCSFIHAVTDTFFAICSAVIIGHLIRLKSYLARFGVDDASDEKALVDVVQLHSKLLSAFYKINSCMSVMFTAQSIYTIVHACVILYTIVTAADVYAAAANMVPMLIGAYAELIMYCFFGQKLTDEFDDLTFASYNNYWYQSPLHVRKGLLKFSSTSVRTVALRSFGSTEANLKAYLEAFQASVSYYLILKTVTSKDK